MRSGRLILSLYAAVIASCAWAMETVDTSQGVIAPSFHSLQVVFAGSEMGEPVIDLHNPADRVVISFDELSDDRRYMRYSLVHCDALWQPEGLVDSEFLDSFNEGTVEDYDYSQATIVHYVHYTITLPNEQVRITQPGNYLVKVYDESDPEETLLQARFYVSDNTVGIKADVTTRTDIDTNLAHQQLGLTVDTRYLNPEDPFNDLKVVVTQNGRPDTETVIVSPQRLGSREVIYEHLRPLIFPAGNEYRRFETVSTNYPGMGVERIERDAPVYNMMLYADEPRSSKDYLFDRTQHGRYLVRSSDVSDSSTEADYVMTNFTLAMPPLAGYDIFIDGDLTDRRFSPSSRMVYNEASGAYEQSLLLKQGSYNYQYLAVPSGSLKGETGPVEGNKYQTVNEYTIKVYHRPKGTRFDRLVGYGVVSSE